MSKLRVFVLVYVLLLGFVLIQLKNSLTHAHVTIESIQPSPPSIKMGAIVRLVMEGKTVCTGTVVTDSVIITAAHCVLDEGPLGPLMREEPFEVRDDDNKSTGIEATPYVARVQLDQALLMGDFTKFDKKPYITNVKRLNELTTDAATGHMYACGYPLGGHLYCSKMAFKRLHDFMWMTNGLLIPGMSGGPVMLEDGTVVAVNVAVDDDMSLVSPIYNLDVQFRSKK